MVLPEQLDALVATEINFISLGKVISLQLLMFCSTGYYLVYSLQCNC